MKLYSRLAQFTAIMKAQLFRDLSQYEQLILANGYKSHGKGRGAPPKRFGNKPGRYRPHQGAQEIARRAARGW